MLYLISARAQPYGPAIMQGKGILLPAMSLFVRTSSVPGDWEATRGAAACAGSRPAMRAFDGRFASVKIPINHSSGNLLNLG